MQIEGTAVPVGPGDLLCIPPDTMHYDRSFEPRINAILHFPANSHITFEGFRLFHDSNRAFQSMFDLAYEAQLNQYPNAELLISALGDAMFQLLRSWGYGAGQGSGAVSQLQRCILDRFSDPDFDLAVKIRETGYNINYFRRLFKSAYGLPPLEYLNHVRLEHAKGQMQLYGRSISIQTYARSSGFADPAYFSRLFRQAVGCSPSTFLENLE